MLQSLVDDDMVECEKVGTSSFYWAFPSKATNARKRKLEQLEILVKDSEKERASTIEAIDVAKHSRNETVCSLISSEDTARVCLLSKCLRCRQFPILTSDINICKVDAPPSKTLNWTS